MVRSKKSDWLVRVKHPNGNWAEVDVVGQPARQPKVNGLPGITIPVRNNDKWDDAIWEEQEMEVYYKGERQPIEQFERLERSEGETRIAGRGGIELRNVVDTEYKEEQTTTVAQEVINNNSTYTPNVDAVTGGSEQNVQIDSATTTSDFQNRTSAVAPTDPIVIENGELRLAQTNFVTEGEDQFLSEKQSDPDYSNGEGTFYGGAQSQFGDTASYTMTPQYDVPGSAVSFNFRLDRVDGDNTGTVEPPEVKITFNGQTVFGPADFRTTNTGLGWDAHATNYTGPDLSAGNTYTLTIEVTDPGVGSADDKIVFDVVSLYDNRFSYTFDNSVNNIGGALAGPELYPSSFDVEFDAVSPARAVTGGRVESTWDSVAVNQQLGLSNDGGTSYNTNNNTDTFETDFASAGTSLRFRARLSRYGKRNTGTPNTGFEGQTISDYTLFADLQTIPFVIDQTLNDRLVDVLNDIAGTGNFVWEFNIDNQGNKTIDFTTNRQRETVTSLPLTDFDINKELSNVVEKIILFGGTNDVARERISANHGTAVNLNEEYLKEGSESVNDADTDQSFIRGDDYTVNYRTGEITTLSTGNITDGENLDVSYSWKVRATATKTGATDPRVEVIEIPQLTTQALADNIAQRILNELSVLEETVDLTIPATVTDFSAIDALNVEELPTDETFQIKQITGTTKSIQVSAGNRESLQELTEEINSQLRSVSRTS